MKDRYQYIIDSEKTRLNVRLAAIERRHKRTMFVLYLAFAFILLIASSLLVFI